jgi:hypothetical protein
VLLTLWSCRKDEEAFEPYPPSANALRNLLEQQVPPFASQKTFSFNNLTEDQVLEMPSGTKVFLIDTDHLFDDAATGSDVLCSTCADLKIEVTEILDKSDIVARGLNTVAQGDSLFECGGMVRVTVTCNGKPLALSPDRSLKIQIPNAEPADDLQVFSDWNAAQQMWTRSNQAVFRAEWPFAGSMQQGYELLTKQLGWSACGKILAEPSSSFCLTLPAGFGEQNTLSQLVFINQQVVAPLRFDLSANTFCFPNVPTGFQVQLFSVSKLGDQYWMGKAQTESGTNTQYPMTTQMMSEQAILDFVKGL